MKVLQHLSAILIITMIIGLIYFSVQQTYRTGADDPQAEMLHSLKERLEKGKPLSLEDTIQLESSLSVFKTVYDQNGEPLQSTGWLDGKMPTLPKGVFETAKANGELWVSWQPQRDVRIALGVVRVTAAPIAYLAVGRSLKEVEKRISRLADMMLTGWILCISVVLMNWLVTYYDYRKKLQTHDI